MQQSRRSAVLARWPLVILLATPAIAATVLVYIVPFFGTIRLSFTEWPGIGTPKPVGLDNYRQLLSDSNFYSSVKVTLLFAVATTVGVMILAVWTALVARRGRGNRFFQIVWFLPAIAPGTAVAVFWGFSFQPISGAVNGLLGRLGLGDGHTWLASPDTAIWVVIFVAIWSGTAFPFLIILGAVLRISPALYEAAELDGATGLRQAWHVTLPMIQPVLAMMTLLELIWNFNSFTIIWGMTRGGPVSSTSTLPVLLYRAAFKDFDFGTASAIGVLASVVLVAVGLLGLGFTRSRSAD